MDMPAVWSAYLLCGLLCSLLLRVLFGVVRWSYAVVFALLVQVSKWVSGCVVLEAVRVVHVIICKCVVQRGVAVVHGYPRKAIVVICCPPQNGFY